MQNEQRRWLCNCRIRLQIFIEERRGGHRMPEATRDYTLHVAVMRRDPFIFCHLIGKCRSNEQWFIGACGIWNFKFVT